MQRPRRDDRPHCASSSCFSAESSFGDVAFGYVLDYAAVVTHAKGRFNCAECHPSSHPHVGVVLATVLSLYLQQILLNARILSACQDVNRLASMQPSHNRLTASRSAPATKVHKHKTM
jgi:hypothetical protein